MRYHGFPAPDLPLPFFLLGASRLGLHAARDLYDAMTAHLLGAGAPHDETGQLQTLYDDVRARAYPDLPQGSPFALKQSDG